MTHTHTHTNISHHTGNTPLGGHHESCRKGSSGLSRATPGHRRSVLKRSRLQSNCTALHCSVAFSGICIQDQAGICAQTALQARYGDREAPAISPQDINGVHLHTGALASLKPRASAKKVPSSDSSTAVLSLGHGPRSCSGSLDPVEARKPHQPWEFLAEGDVHGLQLCSSCFFVMHRPPSRYQTLEPGRASNPALDACTSLIATNSGSASPPDECTRHGDISRSRIVGGFAPGSTRTSPSSTARATARPEAKASKRPGSTESPRQMRLRPAIDLSQKPWHGAAPARPRSGARLLACICEMRLRRLRPPPPRPPASRHARRPRHPPAAATASPPPQRDQKERPTDTSS